MTNAVNDSLKSGVNLWLLRGIGAFAMLAGLPFLALFVFVVMKLGSRVSAEPVIVLAALVSPALIAAFLLSVGWRLLFNRPNKYNSLLHPVAWWVIAILLVATGSCLAFVLVAEARYDSLGTAVLTILFGLASAVIGMRTASGTWLAYNEMLSGLMGKNPWSFKLASLRGVPLRIHWSLPAGGLMISLFSGFRLSEWFYYCLAFLILIAIHELGHFAAARFFGLKVFSVEISGFGGQCNIQSPRGARDTLGVFSAGLLAQCALFLLTLMWISFFGRPTGALGKCFVYTFTFYNVALFVINLIPSKTLNGLSTDGLVLWQVILHIAKGAPLPFSNPVATGRLFPPETSLLSLAELSPAGFTTGIEFLNDTKTPMEFVVTVLTEHLQINREEAIGLMLQIHNSGGTLVPIDGLAKAEVIAKAITEAAHSQEHPFICRAVDARVGQMSSARSTESS